MIHKIWRKIIFRNNHKMKPKFRKKYYFVRINNQNIEKASFICYEDNSALIIENNIGHIFENDSLAWQNALSTLTEKGFIEISKAKKQGIIPSN